MQLKIILSLMSATLVAGCSRIDSPQAGDAAPGNWVRILAVSPAPPAKLRAGEAMNFKLAYSHTNAGPVLIMTQPYAKGQAITDFAGAGSPAYPPGTGEGLSYFAILHGTSDVDQVRITMTDFKTHTILVETNVPVQARWE